MSNELVSYAEETQLDTRWERVNPHVMASLSANTRRAYKLWYGRYKEFLACSRNGAGNDLSDATLAEYLSHLDEEGMSISTVCIASAGVKWVIRELARAQGAEISARAFYLAEAVLKRIRRESLNRGIGQTGAIRHADLVLMCHEARSDALTGLRDIAIMRTMRDALLRVSEVVAVNIEDLQEKTLYIPRSKTDQFGEGVHLYLTNKTRDAIHKWVSKAGLQGEDGALFRTVLKHRLGCRLYEKDIQEIIKRWAKAAGVEKRVTAHSFRVGAAVDLASKKASVIEMQRVGRWRSTKMPAHYASAILAEDSPIAKYFEGDE